MVQGKITMNSWVSDAPPDVRVRLKRRFQAKAYEIGYKGEDVKEIVESGMNSRFRDIGDMVNVSYWLNEANKLKTTKKKKR